MNAESYLDARAAAAFVGYDVEADARHAVCAFYAFVRRHGVPTLHRGRRLLFRRADLVRAVEGDDAAKRCERLERMEVLARQHARGEESTLIS